MDTGILTSILNNFVSVATLGYAALVPEAMSLLQKFIVLEIVLMGIFSFAFGEASSVTAAALKKLVAIGFYIYLIKHFETISGFLFKSFGKAGILAGGSAITPDALFDPSSILELGFDCIGHVLDSIGAPWDVILNPIESLFKGFICIAILITFFIIALNNFVIIIEFYVFTVCSVILMPFGLFKPTTFLAEGAIGAAFKLGIKFMVFSFILCISFNVLQNLYLPHDPEFKELFVALFTSFAIAWLSGKAPEMASSLISANPNLSGPTVQQIVIGGATTMIAGGFMARKMSSVSKSSVLSQAASRKR